MAKGVALLADGRNSDLYSSFCAVKLAKRIDAKLYSILLTPHSPYLETGQLTENVIHQELWRDFSPSSFLQLISSLCDFEKVEVSYHLISEDIDNNIVSFLISQKISCVILGTLDEMDFEKKQQWSSTLAKKVMQNPQWYLGDLTIFLARPWSDENFKKILKQMNINCNLYPIEMVFA